MVSGLKVVYQYYKEPARNPETETCQYGTLTHSSPFRVGRTVTDFAQYIADTIIALHTVSNTRPPPQSALLLTSFNL